MFGLFSKTMVKSQVEAVEDHARKLLDGGGVLLEWCGDIVDHEAKVNGMWKLMYRGTVSYHKSLGEVFEKVNDAIFT